MRVLCETEPFTLQFGGAFLGQVFIITLNSTKHLEGGSLVTNDYLKDRTRTIHVGARNLQLTCSTRAWSSVYRRKGILRRFSSLISTLLLVHNPDRFAITNAIELRLVARESDAHRGDVDSTHRHERSPWITRPQD